MRISIGHRLFAAVLLAILAVTATGIALMRHKVLASFADYAVEIELERLEELSALLGRQYLARGDWSFIAKGADARRDWIASELQLLQERRVQLAPPAPPAAPPAPAGPSPVAPAAPAPDAADAADPTDAAGAAGAADAPAAAPLAPPRAGTRPQATPAVPPIPPLPSPIQAAPAPPMPALPPLPPPPPAPRIVSDGPLPAIDLPLQDRITLYDAAGGYLAGHDPGVAPTVRRPVIAGGKTVGHLAVARPLRPSDELALLFLGDLTHTLVAIVAVSVALSALAAALLAGHFRKPVLRLADGTRELAAGRFDTRLDIDRSDELGELASHFNQLAERLESAERMRRDWVADTSHELRTPVSVLRAQIEAMLDGVRPATRDSLEVLERQVLSLNKLIDELDVLARTDVGQLEYSTAPVDAWELFTGEAQAFRAKLDAAGLALETGAAPARATVLADPDRLRQVFRNLLENSVRYTSAGGTVRLSAVDEGDRILLLLDDSAPAVPDDALARLTERFYRVDASRSRQGGGAGLGLSLCERIVQAHGGTLAFAHSPLGGLRACVSLPFSKDPA
ncbi:ATP-binding protein [Pseudoduganella sp. GCM10020061]|uniref:ATP-binding protein n=1 Tax=Pseudoduganella sp. GCM10020061 TaxID=3317345 RepID=UPI0036306F9B